MNRLFRIALTLTFGVVVLLFWWLGYPQLLGFKEQNQLFLFTWDYLGERLRVAGGLADWISEFLVQFNVITGLGAALYAAILVLLQLEIWFLTGRKGGGLSYSLSFVPSMLLLVYQGDIFVVQTFAVALCLTMGACLIYAAHPSDLSALILIPALLWLAGPVAWIFVAFAAIKSRNVLRAALYLLFCGAFVWIEHRLLLRQYPLEQVVFGIAYYSIPLEHPVLQHVTAALCLAIPLACPFIPRLRKCDAAVSSVLFLLLACGTYSGTRRTYNRDIYEIIALDQLVRHERWTDIVNRAEKYQPHADLACVSINLALYMTGQFDRLDEFWQCGTRGLLMPRVRDYISNVSTGEAFWRLGFINESLRYAFDTQESNPLLRKSPRSMMRMAECQILNGRYKVASKYIDILKHTLFYRGWALEKEKFLFNEGAVNADPLYAYLLSVRPKNDYLYYYPHMETMLGRLYMENNNNVMAGRYCVAWHKMKENEDTAE